MALGLLFCVVVLLVSSVLCENQHLVTQLHRPVLLYSLHILLAYFYVIDVKVYFPQRTCKTL